MPPQPVWICSDPSTFISATLWHRLPPGGRLTGTRSGRAGRALQRMGGRGLEVAGPAVDGAAVDGGARALGVVLVIGDDRGHRAQPVHRDRSGPEDLRYGPGQVEDGRRDVLGARPAVEVNRNRLRS